MTSDKIIGIDLGTTNSAVAVLEGGTPEIIENERGNRVTPSVVARKEPTDGDEEWLIGEPADGQEANNPEGTVRSIKRLMGDEDATVELHDEEYHPEEISAKILRQLKTDAERFLGDSVKKAVITVPAYFNSAQRQATKDAAEIADLKPLAVMNEPTAAALAYARDESAHTPDDDNATEQKNIMVFDLGGGTFDVTIMEYGGPVDNVLATNGDNNLGGDDWDAALTDHLADIIEDETGVQPLDNDDIGLSPELRLREKAREAKEDLSDVKETTIHLPYLFPTDDGMYNFEYSLTRAELDRITSDLLDRIDDPVNQALEDASDPNDPQKPDDFSPSDIDEIILVGGSTRMPQIRNKVDELLSMEPKYRINPDEVVAKGAAYKAGSIAGEVTGVTLLENISLSIGLKIRNGLFERVVKKNTTIPTEVTKTFTTSAANQTSVNIEVYQGERELAEENHNLGEFVLTEIPPAPAGTPQIDVTFSVDEDGILSVKAEESITGVNKEVTIQGDDTSLDPADIEDMKAEAERHANEDAKRREQIDIRNDAEKAAQRAHTMLDDHGDVISPSLRTDIHTALDTVEKYLDVIDDEDASVDYDEVREATVTLNKQVEQIGRDVYQPEDAYQDEHIDVENPEQDTKSAVPSEPDDDGTDE